MRLPDMLHRGPPVPRFITAYAPEAMSSWVVHLPLMPPQGFQVATIVVPQPPKAACMAIPVWASVPATGGIWRKRE
jgi:hypothetical protein